MRYLRSLMVFLFLGVTLAASGQYTKEFKRIFFEAEYLYQTGFYEEAFNRYKNLLTLDPGNSNILFLCGACCLNIPGNEDQSISYLQDAVSGVSLSYKDGSHKESAAPVLTYFILGRAFHLNNRFEQAIENYELYIEKGADEDPFQLEYAQLQIEACHRAKTGLMNAPLFEFQSVLDHFEGELPSCNNPVISGDGNLLIFLVDYPNDKKIMMTRRNDDFWSWPEVISSEIGMVGETSPASLSYDGKTLYLVHQFYSHSDIFVSRFDGERWSEAEALGSNVNGRTSEGHASISKDGKNLYFTSDARGGEGSFDIYVSRLNEKGEWGAAENLGPIINTAYEEHTPFISSNDSILFFSSQGHEGMGGMDVFYAELGADGKWMEPRNLGYPVNNPEDNVFFNPGWNELDGYYAVKREDDPGSNSINMVIELDPAEVLAETVQDDSVQGEVAVTLLPLEKVIEPEVTDDIMGVLNQGNDAPETEPETAPETPVIIYKEMVPGSKSIQTMVPFDLNKFELNMAAMLEVERMAEVMHAYPDATIILTGHADAIGAADYNILISNHRADQIAAYLEMRGIDRQRITLEGKGELAPVARNSYPDGSDAPLGRYLNRQVVVTIDNPEPMQAELSGFYVPSPLKVVGESEDPGTGVYWFTVQLAAAYQALDNSHFMRVEQLEEYICRDGYYRYASGKFRTFDEARTYLEQMKSLGYPDAFIQTLMWYAGAVK